MIIALEGVDAAGKNAQAKRLIARLEEQRRKAVLYSFPRYETELGKTIRRHLMNETFVAELGEPINAPLVLPAYMAQRVHTQAPEDPLWFQCAMLADKMEVADEIREHHHNGTFVVCDRWSPSAMAFGAADGLSPEWLERIQRVLPQPNLCVFLDVTEEESLRRRPVLRDRYEKDRGKQARVREEYKKLWAEREYSGAPSLWRWVTIDGNGPDVETVHERIWKHVVQMEHL